MKKILLLLISLIAALDINAQLITVYKNGAFENAYRNTSTTTYKAAISENSGVKSITIYKGDTSVKTYTDGTDTYKVELSSGKLGDYEYVDLGVVVNNHPLLFAKINVGMTTNPTQESDYYNIDYTTEKAGCYFKKTDAVDADGTVWKSTWNSGVTGSSNWRLPTKAEMDELIAQTDTIWTTNYNSTGARGYIYYKKSGKAKKDYNPTTDTHIFLPAAGAFGESGQYYSQAAYGVYWIDINGMTALLFSKSKAEYINVEADSRRLSVRPVFTR